MGGFELDDGMELDAAAVAMSSFCYQNLEWHMKQYCFAVMAIL